MEKFLLENFIYIFTKQYADFKGRADRRQFWSFILIAAVLYLLIPSLIFIVSLILDKGDAASKWSAYICAAVLIIPFLSIIARRLRDGGHSPFWQLAVYIPCFVFLIFFLLLLHLALQTEQFDDLLSSSAASTFAVSAVISAIAAFIGLIIVLCFLLSPSKKIKSAVSDNSAFAPDAKYISAAFSDNVSDENPNEVPAAKPNSNQQPDKTENKTERK